MRIKFQEALEYLANGWINFRVLLLELDFAEA